MNKLITSILAIVALSGDVLTATHDEGKPKLMTFREALHAANHSNNTEMVEKDRPSSNVGAHEGGNKPKTFFEIVRINERVVLDSKNKAKGYSAKIHSAMYSLDSGHLRRLFATDMLVKPKPGSPVMKRIQAQDFLDNKGPEDGNKNKFDEWFEEIARRYHLEKFWPRLIASILLGFTATLIIYSICYAILWVFSLLTGYDPLGEEPSGRMVKNTSEERLLSEEQERMEESKPLTIAV